MQDNAFLYDFSASDAIEASLSSHSPNESPAENSGAATVDVACFASILDENLVETRKTVERCGDAAFLCGYQQRHQRELKYMYIALAATDDYPTFQFGRFCKRLLRIAKRALNIPLLAAASDSPSGWMRHALTSLSR
jgi:hypothetical protein